MKVCNRCGKEKKKDEFSTQPQNKDGLRGECRVCKNKYNRSYMTKEKRKHASLMHSFGISLLTYNKLKEKQNYCCKICGIHESKLRCDLVVDHCHNSGKIRGLLCESCNLGLGKFYDNQELLSKALNYIKGDLL